MSAQSDTDNTRYISFRVTDEEYLDLKMEALKRNMALAKYLFHAHTMLKATEPDPVPATRKTRKFKA